MCSLISILCTAQWESICTSSKPNHWAGRPNGEAVNSAVENLIRDIHAADLWGCFTYLGLYAKRPFRGIYSIQIRVTSKGAMLLPLVGCLNSASQSLLVLMRKGVGILKDFCAVVRVEIQLSSDQRGTTIRI